jgi:hypothetical protein
MMNPARGLDPHLAALNPKVIDGFSPRGVGRAGTLWRRKPISRPNFFSTAIC